MAGITAGNGFGRWEPGRHGPREVSQPSNIVSVKQGSSFLTSNCLQLCLDDEAKVTGVRGSGGPGVQRIFLEASPCG